MYTQTGGWGAAAAEGTRGHGPRRHPLEREDRPAPNFTLLVGRWPPGSVPSRRVLAEGRGPLHTEAEAGRTILEDAGHPGAGGNGLGLGRVASVPPGPPAPLSRRAEGHPHYPPLNTPWTLVLGSWGNNPGRPFRVRPPRRRQPCPPPLSTGPWGRARLQAQRHQPQSSAETAAVQPLQPGNTDRPRRPGALGGAAGAQRRWGGLVGSRQHRCGRPGLRHVTQQGCLRCPQPPLSMDDATPPPWQPRRRGSGLWPGRVWHR